MIPARRRKRAIVWIGCFAILMNALAPAVSAAVATARQQPLLWAEIAATSGFAHIAAAQQQAPRHEHDSRQHDSRDHSDPRVASHCPFCLVHAGSFGAVAGTPPAIGTLDHLDAVAPRHYHSPLLRFLHAPSQPRAPPLQS